MEKLATKLGRVSIMFLCMTIVAAFAPYGKSSLANGQYFTAHNVNTGSQSYYLLDLYSDQIPEMNRVISLEDSEMTVQQALEQIIKEANLGIAFDSSLPILKRIVEFENRNITVGEALKIALRDSDYEPAISKTREILLVEKEEPDVVIESDDDYAAFQHVISGRIVDEETGDPLPGVNIVVQGTTIGTTTDAEGRYTLEVPDENVTIVITFIGYLTQEIDVDGRDEINVELLSDIALLDDVVVVGYGVQQRTEVTGSVVSIRSRDIENSPVSSFESALQGRLAGVNVAEPSGEPGAATQIHIRGMGSISAGSQPLFVIDGVPISQDLDQQDVIDGNNQAQSRANPLAMLNPNDIESIEVLKDASASAIYGSRGSNGVILVTTKQGDFNRPPEINIRTYAGIQSVFNQPDLMNAEQLIQFTKEARNDAYMWQLDPLNPDSPNYNPNFDPNTNAGREETGAGGNHMIPELYINWDGTDTDWMDLILETATLQNYEMSVRGGSESMTYSLSGGFMDQSGIIDGSGFNRYSLKTNLHGQLTDRFTLGFQMNASLSEHDRKAAHGPYFWRPPGLIYSAMTQSPVVDPFNPDGTYRQLEDSHNQLGNGMTTTQHPLAARDFIDDELQNSRVFGNLSGTFMMRENLEVKSMMGYDINHYQRHFYQGNGLYFRGGDPTPRAQSSASQSFNWLWENTATYSTNFGDDHRITALAGFTMQRERNERNRVVSQNHPDDQVTTIGGGEVIPGSSIQLIEEWSIVSTLARINYTMLDRYMLTATIRTDRSSRFGRDNQTGVFPSASIGWQMTNEPFMADQELFSELKPRLSYGVTGNFQIPNYGSIGLISQNNYTFGNQLVPGAAPSTLGNRELTWETTKQFNAGLDFALMQDRIFGSFDYYISNTEDLLLNVTIPSATGFRTALQNIGEVQNKGFEIQLTSRNMTGSFQWATDFNFSTNKNEVVRLGPEGDPILSGGFAGVRHITKIGYPIGSYYGYVHDGIYMTEQEIADGPTDTQGNPSVGDIRWKDITGDGMITPDDRTVIGDYHPDFQWGITNRFNWRNFDASIFFQGVEGREILNLTARHLKNGEANFNSYAILENRWRSPEEPGDGYHPKASRASEANNNRPSSYQVEDGSYIKLKNITLGYNFSPTALGDFASRIRVYMSVTNVAIWTDYIGLNPEVTTQGGNPLTPGQDYGSYPLSRAFQIGIDMTF